MKPLISDFKPDKTWSLFLDRDGVINTRLVDEYVLRESDFTLIDGVAHSLSFFAGIFGRIVVVTNQQGIGKGLMNENDLEQVHNKMISEINQAGGRIDKIYHCPDLKEKNSFYRKPAIGMALRAKKDFPEIAFHKSVMVGDSISDMIFGKRMKMKTVFIGTDIQLIRHHYRIIDYSFHSLTGLADFIKIRT
jgi:histidinol-phosphate phosphatase family protein